MTFRVFVFRVFVMMSFILGINRCLPLPNSENDVNPPRLWKRIKGWAAAGRNLLRHTELDFPWITIS